MLKLSDLENRVEITSTKDASFYAYCLLHIAFASPYIQLSRDWLSFQLMFGLH